MLDSTCATAHRSAAGGEGGAHADATGRSRGGRTTKLHALVDQRGRLVAFVVTAGQRRDAVVASELIARTADAHSLARGTRPVIHCALPQAPAPLRRRGLQAPQPGRAPSAGSRTCAASEPATTSSPAPKPPPSAS
ncbi:transposase [Phenylobacterium zucineum]|uniref:transposase n=1 Tax=Phenylobacterium zucineum TaxID=284016 RepID=UPI0038B32112